MGKKSKKFFGESLKTSVAPPPGEPIQSPFLSFEIGSEELLTIQDCLKCGGEDTMTVTSKTKGDALEEDKWLPDRTRGGDLVRHRERLFHSKSSSYRIRGYCSVCFFEWEDEFSVTKLERTDGIRYVNPFLPR